MLVEVAIISMVLSASSSRCEPGNRMFSVESQTSHVISVGGNYESTLLYSGNIDSAIARDLSSVLEIKRVSVERAEGNLLVWIAADNPSREVREKIFQKQFDLIDGFPEISFDFNIVSSRERSSEEFASEGKLVYEREG